MRARQPFRMRSALAMHEMDFGPNMTPMVDVVMVLLVFFMGATTIAGAEWFVHAAVAGEGTQPPRDATRLALRLEVQSAGPTLVLGLADTGLSLDDFAETIARTAQELGPDSIEVALAPAGDVPYQDAVRVIDACAAAGIERVGVLSPTPEPTPEPTSPQARPPDSL